MTDSTYLRRPRPFATVAVLSLTLAFALSSCGGDEADSDSSVAGTVAETAETGEAVSAYPVTVEDCGEEKSIETAPEAVMTVGADAISLLDAAGASDRIVARSGEFGAGLPEGLADPPQDAEVVDPSDPTTEQIIGSGAETVIGYGFFNADPESLADAGIETLTVSGECGHDSGDAFEGVTFDVVLDDIERFGKIFDSADIAARNIADLQERLDAAALDRPEQERTAAIVYYFSSSSAMSTYGGAGIAQSMMTQAGLDNVYGDQNKTYLDISLESLLEADPEVLVVAHGLYGETSEEAKERLLAEPGARDLQAVRQGRIVGVPATQTSASPAAVTGLELLVRSVAELD